jgi:hypothetical protein
MARVKTPKPKTAAELARSVGSSVARASFARPGGTMGKQGARANRHDRRSARQGLRGGDWD